jgi:hypothetical protein
MADDDPVELGIAEAEIAAAWAQAAIDLGIAVDGAGAFRDGNGEPIVYAARVRDFGSANGMLCLYRASPSEFQRLRDQSNTASFGWSVLRDGYRSYDRDVWIDTLNDWGWAGSGEPPDWYSGEPWSP